jgi:hypothetical protein
MDYSGSFSKKFKGLLGRFFSVRVVTQRHRLAVTTSTPFIPLTFLYGNPYGSVNFRRHVSSI